jgi:hypothetical protein
MQTWKIILRLKLVEGLIEDNKRSWILQKAISWQGLGNSPKP